MRYWDGQPAGAAGDAGSVCYCPWFCHTSNGHSRYSECDGWSGERQRPKLNKSLSGEEESESLWLAVDPFLGQQCWPLSILLLWAASVLHLFSQKMFLGHWSAHYHRSLVFPECHVIGTTEGVALFRPASFI